MEEKKKLTNEEKVNRILILSIIIGLLAFVYFMCTCTEGLSWPNLKKGLVIGVFSSVIAGFVIFLFTTDRKGQITIW